MRQNTVAKIIEQGRVTEDEAEAIFSAAVEAAKGKLTRDDFDERNVKFMRELEKEVAEKAIMEFATYTVSPSYL